jgi:N-acetylglucosamine-6-phosphate deacetylase
VERSDLVTDAVMPAGCSPGRYRLGEVDVELHSDGSVRLLGGTRLAGSALMMDRAIGNVVRLGGVSLRDAITMATRNPARVGRIASRQRGLAVAERADLVRFQYDGEEVRVIETYVGGEMVFQAPDV